MAMSNSENIRNISIIGHVDHGKGTLLDCLINKAGALPSSPLSRDGDGRNMVGSALDEQVRVCCPIRSPVKYLYYLREEGDGKEAEDVPYLATNCLYLNRGTARDRK